MNVRRQGSLAGRPAPEGDAGVRLMQERKARYAMDVQRSGMSPREGEQEPGVSGERGVVRWLRRLAGLTLRLLHVYPFYILGTRGYLYEIGWFRSFREHRAVDAEGKPIPWLTYPAIAFLEDRVRKEMAVFEYGAGSSSLWWSRHVKRIITCEHDRTWFERVKRDAPENLELHLVEQGEGETGGAYCRKVSEYKSTFDIVVIDGVDRVNCGRQCLSALKEDGVILWDNGDRACWNEGYELLKERGFKRIDFVGIAPIIQIRSCTTIFYRSRNCLGI